MAVEFGLRGRRRLIQRADQARDAREWERAAILYERALQHCPDRAPIWVQYGHMVKESGKLERAEEAYRRAISLDPNVADTHRHMAHLLMRLGKRDQAEAHYLRAFALDPSSSGYLSELIGLGWSERRISELREIVAHKPEAGNGARATTASRCVVLILIDHNALEHLAEDTPPRTRFSHDRNLLQFAHEALRRKFAVWVAPIGDDPNAPSCLRVHKVFPRWSAASNAVRFADLSPDIVVAVFPDALNVRSLFPTAKIVAIHAAIHWIESPEIFPARHTFNVLTAIKYNVDFIITQNRRMAEILAKVYHLFVQWPFEDRILVAPLGIVPEELSIEFDRAATREEMGLRESDIAIINAGGVWRWTDVNTFLRAFGEFIEETAAPFKLYLMGLVQAHNHDHDAYITETEAILERFKNLVGKNIVVYRDWIAAGRLVAAYTGASDIGLNVNMDSLENWQSHRVRSIEYLGHGIPVINTLGDLFSEEADGAHVFLGRSGDIESYKVILRQIWKNPSILSEKAQAMKKLHDRYDTQAILGRIIDHISRTPRRVNKDYIDWDRCLIEYAAAETELLSKRRGA